MVSAGFCRELCILDASGSLEEAATGHLLVLFVVGLSLDFNPACYEPLSHLNTRGSSTLLVGGQNGSTAIRSAASSGPPKLLPSSVILLSLPSFNDKEGIQLSLNGHT